MYTTQFWKLICRQLQISRILQCDPFELDETLKRLRIANNPKRIGMFQFQLLISWAYLIILLLHIILGSLTIEKKYQGFFFLIMYLMLNCWRGNYGLDISQIQLINSCMNFEDYILQGSY